MNSPFWKKLRNIANKPIGHTSVLTGGFMHFKRLFFLRDPHNQCHHQHSPGPGRALLPRHLRPRQEASQGPHGAGGHCVVRECQVYTKKERDIDYSFFSFGWILGSASGADYPVSLSNHVSFTPRLLYSSTHHSPERFTHLKTGWAQDAWLQWSYENCYFHLDISRW